ncbi:MAG: hypothetical protein HZA61_06760 [Candidatus Eisenbacteria bacterium]|uniref:Uncharacterized protein n=1 Tax=Eiseniibacteriota bacterium TaxID=2212470 RepID=A0A933SAX0_UNCEI|nr:hypothetical protein [Candidatus Eisenbacteria bacterium]
MANTPKRAWRDRLGAAVCLPAALCSVLIGLVPAPVHAARSISSATLDLQRQIQYAARQGPVTLLLVEGLPISGRLSALLGDWSDSTSAEDRYEAWRAAQTVRAPRADERIAVVMNDGDTLRGAFEGVTGNAIALRTTTSFAATPAYFARVQQVLGDEGEVFGPWAELRARLAEAPELAVVSLTRGVAGTVLVSRTRIVDVEGVGAASSSSAANGDIALVLVIGVIAALIVCAVQVDNTIDDIFTCGAPKGSANARDRQFGRATLGAPPAAWPRGTIRRP